jgi:hypothetical protein
MFSVSIPGLVFPLLGSTWRPCDDTKCGQFGALFMGPYTSENFMGLQIAIATVLYIVTFGIKKSMPVIPLAVLWLLATGSRTSQIGILVAVCLAAIIWLGRSASPARRRKNDTLAKRLALSTVPLIFIGISAQIILTSQRSDYSGRGLVWGRAVQVMTGHELFGLGIDGWVINQLNGSIPPQLGAHSAFLMIYFSGGTVAIALLALFIGRSLISSMRADGSALPSLAVTATVLTIGLLEVVWNPMAVDGMMWIPLCLVISSGEITAPQGASYQQPISRPRGQGAQFRKTLR